MCVRITLVFAVVFPNEKTELLYWNESFWPCWRGFVETKPDVLGGTQCDQTPIKRSISVRGHRPDFSLVHSKKAVYHGKPQGKEFIRGFISRGQTRDNFFVTEQNLNPPVVCKPRVPAGPAPLLDPDHLLFWSWSGKTRHCTEQVTGSIPNYADPKELQPSTHPCHAHTGFLRTESRTYVTGNSPRNIPVERVLS